MAPNNNENLPAAMDSPNTKAERNRRKKENAKKKKVDAKLKEVDENELLEELRKLEVSIGVKPEAEAAKANPSETEKEQIRVNVNKMHDCLFKEFNASSADMHVIGKHTPQEMAKAREVDAWYEQWQLKNLTHQTLFKAAMEIDFATGSSTSKSRTKLLSAILVHIERDLKALNKFGLSDDVLAKYIARLVPPFMALVDQIVEAFRRGTAAS